MFTVAVTGALFSSAPPKAVLVTFLPAKEAVGVTKSCKEANAPLFKTPTTHSPRLG